MSSGTWSRNEGDVPEETRLAPLSGLRFSTFAFTLEARTPMVLPPNKSNVFRGLLGPSFQRALREVDAAHVYDLVFNPRFERDTLQALNLRNEPPLPYLIEPPETALQAFEPGQQLSFRLVLVGDRVRYWPYLVHAFDRLGERSGLGRGRRAGLGRFRIAQVRDHQETLLFTSGGLTGASASRPLGVEHVRETLNELDSGDLADCLRLHFRTGTRIKTRFRRKKRGLIRPRRGEDFLALIDSLYLRMFRLTQLYARSPEDPVRPYEPLRLEGAGPTMRDSTIYWYDWKRHSGNQNASMKLGGFLGEVTFCGGVLPFLPLLRLGEHLHIGAGATFGLGKFEVLPVDCSQAESRDTILPDAPGERTP